jgi:hypothetical protein
MGLLYGGTLAYVISVLLASLALVVGMFFMWNRAPEMREYLVFGIALALANLATVGFGLYLVIKENEAAKAARVNAIVAKTDVKVTSCPDFYTLDPVAKTCTNTFKNAEGKVVTIGPAQAADASLKSTQISLSNADCSTVRSLPVPWTSMRGLCAVPKA